MLIAKSDPAVNNVGRIIWMLEEKHWLKKQTRSTQGSWGDGDNLLCNASRIDQDIRSSVLVNHCLDGILNRTTITNINLEEFNWNGISSQLVKLSGGLIAQLLVSIKNNKGLSTSLNTSTSHVISKTSCTTTKGHVSKLIYRV